MDGRPNGGSRRLRGTFNSAVSCGRRRGEGAARPDTRKREEEAGWKEGGRDGRTAERRRQGVTGHFQISCELWAAARGGRRTTRQKKEGGG